MTADELDELLGHCPTVFHMAEQGAWSSIHDRGLLSTTALLDLYRIEGERRIAIEQRRRPHCVTLARPNFPNAVVRDQIPMDDAGLRRSLPRNMSPTDWYRLLNSKVFFWFTRDRLLRLLNADSYRLKVHDVLEVDARLLVERYATQIWFCPMNSGCTKPMPHSRDQNTFQRIHDYPYATWKRKRRKGERVVELAVDYGVTDISQFVTRVIEMRGNQELRTIYPR